MDRKVTGNDSLHGVTILDFSQAQAGPMATQVLADFGARVIKVERPVGDLMRKNWGHEVNGFFLPFSTLNRGKESLCLDLRDPRGKEAINRLLPRLDIIVHNFRPGVMERLGLGYEELSEKYPRLIYGEATGFGPGGPLGHKGGQDLLAQALGGAMWQNSPDGVRPRQVGFPVADYSSGMGLASGLLMALYARERTGRGSKVSTSLLEAIIFAQLQEVTEAMSGFKLAQGQDPLAGIFQAKDGYLVVMPIWRPNAVEDFLEVVGLQEHADDPRMSTREARQENEDWVRQLVEEKLKTETVAHWIERLESKDLLCSPVMRMEDVASHPQVESVEPFITMRKSDGDVIARGVLPHIRISGEKGKQSVVPALGEHTRSILQELDFSEQEIDQMFADGVAITA